MAPPRRLILHTEASLGLGGQELRILTETRWLLDHGWDALIACQPESQLLAEASAGGIPVVAVPMRSPVDVRAFRALRRLVHERDVALVHTHSSVDSWLGGLAGRSLGRPVVRSRHVSIPIPRRRALVYHLAHRVLTTGDVIKAIVCRAGVPAEKIVSAPAGVDTTRFHPGVSGAAVRRGLGLAPATKLVGLVANVRGSKGHDYFLAAARTVIGAEPATRFLIVGDGIGFDEVRRHVREMGLEREVRMTGFRRDIPEVMATLDVLVLPSLRSEGTPQVILQALAVGRPVVATAVGSIPEIVRDGQTGRLVPPADADALAAAILELLRDPTRAAALAAAGRALIQAGYTVDAVMATTTSVYADLLGR